MKRWAFFRRFEIRGPDGSLYMRRLRIVHTPWFAVYFHRIYRSDHDRDLHDHPWDFTSLILRGGYEEYTPEGPGDGEGIKCRFFGPGSVVRHRAEDLHRVALRDQYETRSLGHVTYRVLRGPRTAWTLVFCGRRRREWGFQTENGWMRWDEYHAAGSKT